MWFGDKIENTLIKNQEQTPISNSRMRSSFGSLATIISISFNRMRRNTGLGGIQAEFLTNPTGKDTALPVWAYNLPFFKIATSSQMPMSAAAKKPMMPIKEIP